MSRNRRILYIGIALLLAVATVLFIQRWLEGEVERVSETAAAEAVSPAAQVLVATRSLPPGTILQQGDLGWQRWPADAPLESYITPAAGSPESLAGAVVRTGLSRGEPVRNEGVVHPGDRSFLAAVLQPGFRAVTIGVSAATGVAGFIRPGDRIDLILSRVVDGAGGARRVNSETLLHNVRVVGVDQQVNNEGTQVTVVPQTATIEVTPEQAEMVAGASELGKLSLALRSIASADTPPDEGADPATVLSATEVGAPVRARVRRAARPRAPVDDAAERSSAATVEVVRGNRSDEGASR